MVQNRGRVTAKGCSIELGLVRCNLELGDSDKAGWFKGKSDSLAREKSEAKGVYLTERPHHANQLPERKKGGTLYPVETGKESRLNRWRKDVSLFLVEEEREDFLNIYSTGKARKKRFGLTTIMGRSAPALEREERGANFSKTAPKKTPTPPPQRGKLFEQNRGKRYSVSEALELKTPGGERGPLFPPPQ